MLHSNFTQNRSWLWHFSSFVCCLIYSMMRFHESFGTGTRRDNAHRQQSQHTRWSWKPQLPFLTSDPNRQKQIKLGLGLNRSCLKQFLPEHKNTHLDLFFFSRNCSRKRGLRFVPIFCSAISDMNKVYMWALHDARWSLWYCTAQDVWL